MNTTSPTQKSLSEILDEMEQRANAATREPWKVDPAMQTQVAHGYSTVAETALTYGLETAIKNSHFIAAARSDIPKLVKALRRAVDVIEMGVKAEPLRNYHLANKIAGSTALRDINRLLSEPADSKQEVPDGKTEESLEEPEADLNADDLATQNTRMRLALRAADKMAWICDDWVQRNIIDARSALADARLSYGEPFKYSWSKLEAPSVGRASTQGAALLTPKSSAPSVQQERWHYEAFDGHHVCKPHPDGGWTVLFDCATAADAVHAVELHNATPVQQEDTVRLEKKDLDLPGAV